VGAPEGVLAGLAARRHRDLGGQQDLRASVLVTTEASRRAVAEALGRPVELRRFRANLHLDLDAPAFAEERWEAAGSGSARSPWPSPTPAPAA
jgi:uncharacterized protein YcbX